MGYEAIILIAVAIIVVVVVGMVMSYRAALRLERENRKSRFRKKQLSDGKKR